MPAFYYEDSDMPVEFRQRRYFYYLSGLDFPNCTVTYDLRHGKLYAWIQPPNGIRDVIYNGQNPSHEEVSELADFDGVAYVDELEEYVHRFTTQRSGKIYLVHYNQGPKSLSELLESEKAAGQMEGSLFDYTSLLPAMNIARANKSPYEIEMIRRANEITAEAHTNVLRAVRLSKNEADLEAVFLGTCIKNQAKRQAYGAIVGSGINASTLHYVANNEPLKGRQLVCLDAGCEWKCYASDVTRTFPINGKWTKEAKQIYDIVEKMQEECIRMVKPGASYRDIHLHAHRVAAEGLLKIGILKGKLDDLIRGRVTMAFFPHGLGRESPMVSF
jgi:Xaa-Pro dipeptidase